MEKTMDKIVQVAKARGFVYPGSEIYGGLANTWDYGNLGVELKNNVKKAWWKKFVQESKYNVGLDSAILMNPTTWVASGHVGGFSDPLMDCKECKTRHRARLPTAGQMTRWQSISRKTTFPAPSAASTALRKSENSTLCLKHSRALLRMLKTSCFCAPKPLRVYL